MEHAKVFSTDHQPGLVTKPRHVRPAATLCAPRGGGRGKGRGSTPRTACVFRNADSPPGRVSSERKNIAGAQERLQSLGRRELFTAAKGAEDACARNCVLRREHLHQRTPQDITSRTNNNPHTYLTAQRYFDATYPPLKPKRRLSWFSPVFFFFSYFYNTNPFDPPPLPLCLRLHSGGGGVKGGVKGMYS